jgi:hypothetical protein
VPVPLPTQETVLLTPPDEAEARATARGIASAVAPADGLTELQRLLLVALYRALTGHDVANAVDSATPMTPAEVAAILVRRNLAFRTRGVQVMLLCALVLRPLPPEVIERVEAVAEELGVDEGMVAVARDFATGALGLAGVDFERNGYTAAWSAPDAEELHTTTALQTAWDSAVDDPELAARWDALRELPPDTLGRGVWELYRARGFEVPGRPGSAPPLLAQHDWVHVLADYGTTVENELEVFALIARANDDMRAFSLLAMVVSLFETGYLAAGAGLFQADTGHLSASAGMTVRVADAMRRGALCHDTVLGSDSVDFLRVDWFAIADLQLAEARHRYGLTPKSPEAVGSGSVGPWEPGGISAFQLKMGQDMAAREDRPYDPHGAAVV